MLFTNAEAIKTIPHLVRLFFHEAERVYKDKLVDDYDLDLFKKIQQEIIKKFFEVCNLMLVDSLIWSNFYYWTGMKCDTKPMSFVFLFKKYCNE